MMMMMMIFEKIKVLLKWTRIKRTLHEDR